MREKLRFLGLDVHLIRKLGQAEQLRADRHEPVANREISRVLANSPYSIGATDERLH